MKNLDFSKGKISNLILAQALPLTVAQLVHLLYNIVDRIYLGQTRSSVHPLLPLAQQPQRCECGIDYR